MDSTPDIHAEMVARGFARNRKFTRALRYEGALDIRGRRVAVAVDYPSPHLANLPQLYLLDRARDLPDAVAHVEANDRVCYAREEELVLDPHDPRGSVALCMLKIKEALERIGKQELRDEIAQEFPQHWNGTRTYIDLPLAAQNAFAFPVPRDNGILSIITASADQLKRFGFTAAQLKTAERDKVEGFVLKVSRPLTFTRTLRTPGTLAELLKWLEFIDPKMPERLVSGVMEAWPKNCFFLLRAPNGDVGGNLRIPAVLAKSVQRVRFLPRLLKSNASSVEISRVTGEPVDVSFIYRRNFADRPNLGAKRIALVGIGTIGGWLARYLAQSGAGTAGGRLILVDPQVLRPGNLGRHWLGIEHIGKYKAQAARAELARANPDCDVAAIADSALSHLRALLDCDLVIDATGDMPVSDVLNDEFVKARRGGAKNLTSMHVWLEGSGVAARALLVDRLEFACFRCLRHDHGQERAPVLKPDHPVALKPANCGDGAYFAYGVGAPAVAAGLALQMSLDWVKGEPGPRLRTLRLNQVATFDRKDVNVPALEKCPACAAASA